MLRFAILATAVAIAVPALAATDAQEFYSRLRQKTQHLTPRPEPKFVCNNYGGTCKGEMDCCPNYVCISGKCQ
jgi:hypothetical protein